MKKSDLLIILGLYLITSCSQNKPGSIISKNQEQIILNEEIDDPDLENEVENSRNLTKSILDLELAKKLGLNELYLQEEPLSIIFQDPYENLIIFQALNLENENIMSYFKELSQNPNLKIEELTSENLNIKYFKNEDTKKENYIAIISKNKSLLKLKMDLLLEKGDKRLINQYSKLMKSNK